MKTPWSRTRLRRFIFSLPINGDGAGRSWTPRGSVAPLAGESGALLEVAPEARTVLPFLSNRMAGVSSEVPFSVCPTAGRLVGQGIGLGANRQGSPLIGRSSGMRAARGWAAPPRRKPTENRADSFPSGNARLGAPRRGFPPLDGAVRRGLFIPIAPCAIRDERLNEPWCAGVAQLVEQCIRNAWVVGSSPIAGTTPRALSPPYPFSFVVGRDRARSGWPSVRAISPVGFFGDPGPKGGLSPASAHAALGLVGENGRRIILDPSSLSLIRGLTRSSSGGIAPVLAGRASARFRR